MSLYTGEAYGIGNNVSAAKEHHIKLVTTNFTRQKSADIFVEFLFNEEGTELLACINVKHPIYTHYDANNDRCNASFALEGFQNYPYQQACKPRFRISSTLRKISLKAVNRAK